jgi:hypothetical protein
MNDAPVIPALAGTPTPDAPSTHWGVFGVASMAVFLVSIDTTVLFAAFGALRAGFPGSSATHGAKALFQPWWMCSSRPILPSPRCKNCPARWGQSSVTVAAEAT